MAGNTIGSVFKVTTFGESHGTGIGAVIDGCPAGLELSLEKVQTELDRRRPGQSHITTQRKETDTVQFLSGIFDGRTTGTPIAMFIPNEDQRSKDYEHIESAFRPSHADFTYQHKYGLRDYRGGGRSSARTTAAIVAAGAIARQVAESYGIVFGAFVTQVGGIKVQNIDFHNLNDLPALVAIAESNIVRCPDQEIAVSMIDLIESIRKQGDTVGGIITGVIKNAPVGLGEPLFDKLQADLAKAMFSINAVHGFEYGSGFEGSAKRGSENNDAFFASGDRILTRTNFSGGIQGGISNGMDIYFRVAFKPVATIVQAQESVNAQGESVAIKGRGRHDPCVLPRAVPIVEAMSAIVMVDHLLRNRAAKM